MENSEQTTLEALLIRAADTGQGIPDFLAALLDSTVLVPGWAEPASDGEGQMATFAPLTSADGSSVQPFYTSEARLAETQAAIPGYETRYLALPCRAFWDMTRGARLVLNPHSPQGKEFLPGEIAQLLDGIAPMTPNVLAKDTEVLVGAPAQVPDGMEQTLAELFARHPQVERAFLGWKVTPENNDQAYLLVLVGSRDTREAVSEDLGSALVYYSQVHPVDVAFAGPREKHLLTSLQPFYTRPSSRRSLFGRRG